MSFGTAEAVQDEEKVAICDWCDRNLGETYETLTVIVGEEDQVHNFCNADCKMKYKMLCT